MILSGPGALSGGSCLIVWRTCSSVRSWEMLTGSEYIKPLRSERSVSLGGGKNWLERILALEGLSWRSIWSVPWRGGNWGRAEGSSAFVLAHFESF